MGYLDEAIRDHLALQRRRGVASEELERAEAEALGPVAASDLAESVSERSVEDLDAESASSEPALEPESTPDEARSGSSTGSAEPDRDRDQPTEAYDLADLDELLDAEPEPAPAQPEPMLDEPRRAPSDTPVEPDADGDPLEATPDFLQETPEHDRLWFEQKPPKDFDF